MAKQQTFADKNKAKLKSSVVNFALFLSNSAKLL